MAWMPIVFALLQVSSGCVYESEQELPWNAPQSSRPFFPIDLGGSPDEVRSDLPCQFWETLHNPAGEIQSLHCPFFSHSVLHEISKTDSLGITHEGRLLLHFQNNHLTLGRWERKGIWDLTVLGHQAQWLEQKMRLNFKDPFYSNFNFPNEEWAPVIERGEFHERWSLGNGFLYFWIGKTDNLANPEHSLVIQIKKFGF